MEQRKIIHIDMDAFFASVEQRDNPELRGKPIAVGGDSERGVVATASYEARPFGVHSAMSMRVAKRLCPQLIVVPGRYQVYKEVSRQMHEIFHEYTNHDEPISLDEAFLDVIKHSGADYFLWYTPFKQPQLFSSELVLPDTVVYDLSHFGPRVIACDHARMVSLEE